MKSAKNIAETVQEFLLPVVNELGYYLWDVEYVKEGSEWYLRITIDSEDGITIDDCERVAREYTISNGLMLIDNLSVPTDDAYKAWGLDIGKLEAKFKKLKNLGLGTAKEETA